MKATLQEIFTQIDSLNKPEQIKVFRYLEQKIQEQSFSNHQFIENSEYEALLQYISHNSGFKSERSLKEFRGICPDLLNGEDAQIWINQQREQW
ncbi:hypothetical protein ACN4EE_08305 [Geminocystis sp. CENA526]|uniref:hypothetical protein n=1 Tax=Geminocystis sp. CENA526 TaxID=1355871 RepID=UPI003D6E52D5